jgi:HEAT repeat protein
MPPTDDSRPVGTMGDPLDAFFLELARAHKAAAFYPHSHPALRAATARAHDAYTRMQRARGGEADVLELAVSRKGFTVGGRSVGDRVPGAGDLVHECLVRRVSRLYLRPEATPHELGQFLHLLTVDPEDFGADAGFEARLASAGVRHIWANEADFDALLARLEAANRDTGVIASERPEPKAPAPSSTEQQLWALLARLDRETDSVAYQETIELLRGPALELRNTAPPETILPALMVLGQHASGHDSRRGRAEQQMADALLAELANDEVLGWLVERVGRREARGEREMIGRVLTRLGARALPTLLDALAATEDRTARRSLSQVITLFGDSAVAELEFRLRDERWFVVRNMAALLGEIRNKSSVPALSALLAHEDGRVRRAALLALAKTGGALATAQVVRCLTSGDVDLQLQAILAVGAWREPTALPALEAIAQGSGTGDRRRQDPEVRRHAIEALGLVGGPAALRVLADLLKPASFWQRLIGHREPALIRIAAAEALAGIGGRKAHAILAAAAEERGAVADRCRELAATLW